MVLTDSLRQFDANTLEQIRQRIDDPKALKPEERNAMLKAVRLMSGSGTITEGQQQYVVTLSSPLFHARTRT